MSSSRHVQFIFHNKKYMLPWLLLTSNYFIKVHVVQPYNSNGMDMLIIVYLVPFIYYYILNSKNRI